MQTTLTNQDLKNNIFTIFDDPKCNIKYYFTKEQISEMPDQILAGIYFLETQVSNVNLIYGAYELLKLIQKNQNIYVNSPKTTERNPISPQLQNNIGIPIAYRNANIIDCNLIYKTLVQGFLTEKGDLLTFISEKTETDTTFGLSAIVNSLLENQISYSIKLLNFADFVLIMNNGENLSDFMLELKQVKYLFIDNFVEKLLTEYKKFLFKDLLRTRELNGKYTIVAYKNGIKPPLSEF